MTKRELMQMYSDRALALQAEIEAEEAEKAAIVADKTQAESVKDLYKQAFELLHDGIKPIANPDNPYVIEYGMPVIPNMHYILGGIRYVCMPVGDTSGNPVVVTEDNLDSVMYAVDAE